MAAYVRMEWGKLLVRSC